MNQLEERRASLSRPTRGKAAVREAPTALNDVSAQLIDAAERLFAERGIEAVSLREIAAEAGQKNNSAVIYHFRDKKGLLDALTIDRIRKIEGIRQRLIEKTPDLSGCDAAALLKLIWQPLLEVDAKRDRHYFIHFQLAHQVENKGFDRPTAMDPVSYPASARLMTELEARFAHISAKQLRYRIRLVAMMFWSAVSWHDHIAVSADRRLPRRFSLDDTIKLAVAALSTPG
jgi:AcrR family transcriptional regulator